MSHLEAGLCRAVWSLRLEPFLLCTVCLRTLSRQLTPELSLGGGCHTNLQRKPTTVVGHVSGEACYAGGAVGAQPVQKLVHVPQRQHSTRRLPGMRGFPWCALCCTHLACLAAMADGGAYARRAPATTVVTPVSLLRRFSQATRHEGAGALHDRNVQVLFVST